MINLKIESERTRIDRSKTFREKTTMEEKPLKDKVDVGLEPFIKLDASSRWSFSLYCLMRNLGRMIGKTWSGRRDPFIQTDVPTWNFLAQFFIEKIIWFLQKQQFWIILLDQFLLLYLSLRVFVSEMGICVFYHTVQRIFWNDWFKGEIMDYNLLACSL